MTTVAYRNGVLAADSRLNWDDAYATSMTKLTKLPDGSWLSTAGAMQDGERLRKWYEKGAVASRYPKKMSIQGLLLAPDGSVWMFDDDGRIRVEENSDHFVAIGSGAPAALGAMQMGAGAVQAVEIAAKIDLATGLPVQWVTKDSVEPVSKA